VSSGRAVADRSDAAHRGTSVGRDTREERKSQRGLVQEGTGTTVDDERGWEFAGGSIRDGGASPGALYLRFIISVSWASFAALTLAP